MLFLTYCILIALITINASTVIQEVSTKHSYQSSIDENKFGTKALTLLGCGVRVKTIGPIKAKVYSVGLYAEKFGISGKLSKFKTLDVNKLSTSTDLEKTLLEGSFSKSIVLKMARDVGSDTMVNALAESVKPRLGQGADSQNVLQAFQNVLSKGLQNGGAKTNTVFRFDAPSLAKLNVSINGKSHGIIQSPALVKAFFSVYLDKDAVSPTLKQNIAETISKGNF